MGCRSRLKWKAIASRIRARPKSWAAEPREFSEKRQATKESLRVGDTVTVKNKKQQTLTGVILRKNPKTAAVKVAGGICRVAYIGLTLPVADDQRPSVGKVMTSTRSWIQEQPHFRFDEQVTVDDLKELMMDA